MWETIKNSLKSGFSATALTTGDIVVTLIFSVILGGFVYLIYKMTNGKDFYNRSFNKTLALLPLITAGIMLAMQNNLVVGLGMVGALSIVRFRNAVKDTMDLTFLFWSISVGIIVGAGLFELGIIICLVIAVFIFVLDLVPSFKSPCLLVVSVLDTDAEKRVKECVKNICKTSNIKSRSSTNRGIELIFEVKTKNEEELSTAISSIAGITSVSVLSHDGELRF